MARLRSLSFPKFSGSRSVSDGEMSKSPYHFFPAHSRDSSGASTSSSPITSTFSNRSHSRWPSSSSSLATTPDSSANLAKSPLHDLVEDPAERDDELCICDSPFCEHRRTPTANQSDILPHMSTPEWTPGDDYFSDGEIIQELSVVKRRRSGDLSDETLSSRLSRRFPSISSRWKDKKPTTSVSNTNARSAPPSRTSSLRLPSIRRSLASHAESNSGPVTPPFTPIDAQSEPNELTGSEATPKAPIKSLEISIPERESLEEPIDRQELASTPLLPPMMLNHLSHSSEELQSPLQSPSIADHSMACTPISTPVLPSCLTPPLSAKPSTASINQIRSNHTAMLSTDISPLSISDEYDPWAIKLGHANFHIYPEPYYPEVCNQQTCMRLRDDWEDATREYMRQAVRVGEHYGPTSHTYKLTEQKWGEIDAQWRANHERANAEAQASGDATATTSQALPETQPLSKMPSLNDPQKPAKFPRIDDADIVGPMVQYATKVPRQPSKRSVFLRIFTDPSSLLNARANNSR
ncbi:Hypothetical protein R9X50_00391100 [Acrodontium crateriforme]|uniref:Only prolin and serin are matching in the corresponding protein n=1 Tax=Acrodontium crateriforme TaxID=150365 RepID=A0AAQ3M722_9PEZI|nr:Hypothetical protein R9X50_00391100 [Acrodontium crateriforme]